MREKRVFVFTIIALILAASIGQPIPVQLVMALLAVLLLLSVGEKD